MEATSPKTTAHSLDYSTTTVKKETRTQGLRSIMDGKEDDRGGVGGEGAAVDGNSRYCLRQRKKKNDVDETMDNDEESAPVSDDAESANNAESATGREEESVAAAGEEGGDVWDLKMVLPAKQIDREEFRCDRDGCSRVACAIWTSNQDPDTPWHSCLDCQEEEFGKGEEGEEEGEGGVLASEGVEYLESKQKELMLQKCTGQPGIRREEMKSIPVKSVVDILDMALENAGKALGEVLENRRIRDGDNIGLAQTRLREISDETIAAEWRKEREEKDAMIAELKEKLAKMESYESKKRKASEINSSESLIPISKDEARAALKDNDFSTEEPADDRMKLPTFEELTIHRETLSLEASTNKAIVLGRNTTTGIKFVGLSRELCCVSLTNDVSSSSAPTASLTMKREEGTHKVYLDGERLNVNIGSIVSLKDGQILSLYGPTSFAYRVKI